jgi:hypothetical protein
MLKRLLIAVGVLFLILLLIGGVFVYRFRRAFRAMGNMPKMPESMSVAKIVSGGGLFSKKRFFDEPDLGVITDIELSQNDELVVIGQRGAAFLRKDGSFNANVHFDKCNSETTLVKVGAGVFLCRGMWSSDVKLFDPQGKVLWTFGGGMNGVDDATAGDLGSDGSDKVVVGFNGGGGIRLLRTDGKELWKQEDGNVWHVEIAAVDENSSKVIVHSNGRGQLTLRDASGEVLARYTPQIYLSQFSLTDWQDDPHLNKLIAAENGSIYVITMQGQTIAQLPAPGNASIAEPKGTSVHFSGAAYYASLLRHSLWNRSLLYIYDAQRKLVYNEVLDHDCDALRAVPDTKGRGDLLLGCEGSVWRYSQMTHQ